METIRLEFRRGGGWGAIGWYFWRYRDMEPCVAYFEIETKTYHDREYAGPFTLEVVEPDLEPLRIEGCDAPSCWWHSDLRCWFCDTGTAARDLVRFRTTGSTRREAIERFNILARAMGATE